MVFTSSLDRRAFLYVAGTTATTALAGCSRSDADEEAGDGPVLSPPENHGRVDAAAVPHPIYGEELPEATAPAPLHDRSVSTTEFVGERHVLLTFVFTSCTTVCPGLTAVLRRVQDDATERGYEDEVGFLAVTFDPEYDTAAVLESYGEDMRVDFDIGNWYFLRPETPGEARAFVEETFGVAFERADGEAPGSAAGDEATDEHSGTDTARADGDHDRHFVHSNLVLLANRNGLVERAYGGEPPNPATVVDDTRTVVDEW
ncbi:SCO family protein [Halopiger djelfimassiliensis]|uniref:SCO family protein n=1 Tax=Halopiger djelfimassiliensis TaxID=1293047 RepID=UPI000677AF4B|nr:SCO family protein [Halopiger djelfimassiliensis]